MMKIELGDASVLGDAYEQWGHFEAEFLRPPNPGELITIQVPPGFYWRMEPPLHLYVYPHRWRRLLHAITGHW